MSKPIGFCNLAYDRSGKKYQEPTFYVEKVSDLINLPTRLKDGLSDDDVVMKAIKESPAYCLCWENASVYYLTLPTDGSDGTWKML